MSSNPFAQPCKVIHQAFVPFGARGKYSSPILAMYSILWERNVSPIYAPVDDRGFIAIRRSRYKIFAVDCL